MTHGRIPLFPQPCGQHNTVRMPLFGGCDPYRPMEECQCVHIRNPACPEEYADVELCVDRDGNLSICVKRPPKPCAPVRKRRPHCDCMDWFR